MQVGSPTNSGVLYWINSALDVDPRYMRLHHNRILMKWHQYIELMGILVEGLKQLNLEWVTKTLTLALLNS